jgi:hypothetical protein
MTEEVTSPSVQTYDQVQQLQGWDLCEKMCVAVLEIPDLRRLVPPFSAESLTEEQRRNPVLTILMVDHYIPTASMRHRDLARIFLSQLQYRHEKRDQATEGSNITFLDGSPIPSDDDFIPLTRFIKQNIQLPSIDYLPDWLFASPDIEQIISWYFTNAQTEFDEALERICRCVQQGVPLYERTDSGEFRALPFEHPDCTYLLKKAEYDETGGAASERPGQYPLWAERYFLKWGHLAERDRFFGGWQRYHTPEAMTILRDALRRRLGFAAAEAAASDDGTRRKFKTQLSAIVDQILSRNAAEFFGLKSEGEEWPKQELAVRWLQNTFALSDAEARAIDAVTRPDTIRARGKSPRPARTSK